MSRITNEQVKESIEYFKNRNSFELPVYDTQQFSNITQYIAELEKSDASKEESSIRYFNEMKALQSKLDKIKPILGIKPRNIEFEEGVVYQLTKHIKRYVELNMAMQRYILAKQDVPRHITIELNQYDEYFMRLEKTNENK